MMRNMQMMGRNNQNGTNTNNAEELAAAQEQQMQQALDNRAELNTLLQTLQQTQGVTDEQTALIRQRIERSNQQIELLQNQNQQRNTGRDGLTADMIFYANSWIRRVCAETGAYYADLASLLNDDYGMLADTYMTPDGRSISAAGINLIVDYFRSHYLG